MTNKFKIQEIEFDIVKIENDYVIIRYNGIDVMLDSTRKLFNASKLIELINPSFNADGKVVSKWNQLWNNQNFYQFREFYGAKAKITYINKGKHSCVNKGKYLSIELFSEFLETYSHMFYRTWTSGKPIKLPGYVYLEHDSSLSNTQFKLGCTWNINQRLSHYQVTKAKDAHYLFVIRVTNQKDGERIFKEVVKAVKAVQVRGETYEFDDADHVIDMLWSLVDVLDEKKVSIVDESFMFDEDRIRRDVDA